MGGSALVASERRSPPVEAATPAARTNDSAKGDPANGRCALGMRGFSPSPRPLSQPAISASSADTGRGNDFAWARR